MKNPHLVKPRFFVDLKNNGKDFVEEKSNLLDTGTRPAYSIDYRE